jgi:hypothetical protein
MKVLLIILLLPILSINAQKIGQFAEEKPRETFPDNSLGLDLMVGEGGFGLGGFYRHQYSDVFTGFLDLSISESKNERELDRFDIFGRPLPTFGKKNRVFLVPLNFGLQYRLFYSVLTDNLRPYINFGIGPTMVITTPAEREFFKSFGYAKAKFAAGGYFGLGANFGISKSNLVGINIRYYLIHFFDEGVENFYDSFHKDLGHFYLTINLGFMY